LTATGRTARLHADSAAESDTAVQSFANAIIVLWGWRRYLVALVCGAASALAFAPFYAFPVLWVTMPVFVWLIDGSEAGETAGFLRRLLPAAAVGWVFGFGFFLAGLWWIGAAFLVDAAEFAWLLPIAVVALPAGLALFWAAGAMLARVFWVEGPARVLVFAIVMTVAEWWRGHLLTGFPWNAVGYALTPMPVMMQSAALVGLWGLTLAAFVIFAAPAVFADDLRTAPMGRAVLGLAAVLLVAHVGYGAVRLSGGPDPTVPGVHLRIVQPSIPEDERWQSGRDDEIMARYLDLSREGSAASPGIDKVTHLIWPESAFPFVLTRKPSALKAIADLLPKGTTLITGAARAEDDSAGGSSSHVFNSIYEIDDGGEIRAAYDKVHLVPFGEYLPFPKLFEALGLRQLIALPGGFTAGSRLRTLNVPGAPPFGPLICYEIIFPGAVVEPGNRPGWLLNVTNDAWYGDTPGPYQHFLQARVRAVEEGLPLVRAANSGISAIVDAHGRVLDSLGLGRVSVIDGGLPVALSPTPYARYGDVVFLVVLLVTATFAMLGKIYL
jgi:apolipoprotein N-acyltransferase